MLSFFSSMLGRVFVMLVGGVIISAALTLYFANGERQEFIEQLRILRAVERMEQLTLMLDEVPGQTRPQVLSAASRNGIIASTAVQGAVAGRGGEPDREFADALAERLGTRREIRAWKTRDADCAAASGANAASYSGLCETALLSLRDGTELSFVLQLQRTDHALSASERTQRQVGYFIFFICIHN